MTSLKQRPKTLKENITVLVVSAKVTKNTPVISPLNIANVNKDISVMQTLCFAFKEFYCHLTNLDFVTFLKIAT